MLAVKVPDQCLCSSFTYKDYFQGDLKAFGSKKFLTDFTSKSFIKFECHHFTVWIVCVFKISILEIILTKPIAFSMHPLQLVNLLNKGGKNKSPTNYRMKNEQSILENGLHTTSNISRFF